MGPDGLSCPNFQCHVMIWISQNKFYSIPLMAKTWTLNYVLSPFSLCTEVKRIWSLDRKIMNCLFSFLFLVFSYVWACLGVFWSGSCSSLFQLGCWSVLCFIVFGSRCYSSAMKAGWVAVVPLLASHCSKCVEPCMIRLYVHACSIVPVF